MIEPPQGSKDFGSIADEDILKNVVMLENGFNEDDFSKEVKNEAENSLKNL